MNHATPENLGAESSTRSDLADVFQNEAIHDKWESVYRRGRLQGSFNDAIMERLVRHLAIPSGGRVLDAGCGAGDHTIRLAKLGYNCVGVDLSKAVLQNAEQLAAARGLASRVSFFRCGLEDMSRFSNDEFDAIHCRGVLMHVPRWKDVVRELCRVLKPGGRIVILENNHKSVELLIVRLVRLLRSSSSEMVSTEGGIEFHTKDDGFAPVTRVANINYLVSELRKHGVRKVARFATEFWDVNRFPSGICRAAVVMFNRCWFFLRLPSFLSLGNAVVCEKD